MRSRKLKDYLALILLAACVSCFAPQLLRAQDSDDDDSNEPEKPFVNLGISISPDNTARVDALWRRACRNSHPVRLPPGAAGADGCNSRWIPSPPAYFCFLAWPKGALRAAGSRGVCLV